MDRNLAPTHQAHDELLLARLFGGDLDGRELERARALAASCEDCAAILADFGAIAAATAALPVPPRPRDFTIGRETARQLNRKRGLAGRAGLWARLGRLGPVRSLGASMAAVGVAGIIAVGAISLLGPQGAGRVWYEMTDTSAQAGGGPGSTVQPVTDASGKNAYAQGSPSPASVAVDSAAPPQGPEPSDRGGGELTADGSPGPTTIEGFGPKGTTSGGVPPASAGDSSGSGGGSDPGQLWLAGFGALVAGGLVLLAVPGLRRRYAGRRSR